MLKTLTVSNFALIEQASIDFADRLNIVTGETGAGKSILLDSLGLALGQRAESGLVRAGCDQRLDTIYISFYCCSHKRCLSILVLRVHVCAGE